MVVMLYLLGSQHLGQVFINTHRTENSLVFYFNALNWNTAKINTEDRGLSIGWEVEAQFVLSVESTSENWRRLRDGVSESSTYQLPSYWWNYEPDKSQYFSKVIYIILQCLIKKTSVMRPLFLSHCCNWLSCDFRTSFLDYSLLPESQKFCYTLPH